MKARNHNEATAELFKQDTSFAAEYLRQCLLEGTPEDVRVGLQQMTGLLPSTRPDGLEKTNGSQAAGLFDRALVRYDVACDVIGTLIAHYAEIIGRERDRTPVDEGVLLVAKVLKAVLKAEREDLNPWDRASVEEAISRYAPLARRLQQGDEISAERGIQGNAYQALEGSVTKDDDRAVQALLIRGDITHDEAVQCYRILCRHFRQVA